MSNPHTKEAKTLCGALAKKGIKLGHVEALDVVAQLAGFRNHQSRPETPETLPAKIWVAVHNYEYGLDTHIFTEPITAQKAKKELGIEIEKPEGERFEIHEHTVPAKKSPKNTWETILKDLQRRIPEDSKQTLTETVVYNRTFGAQSIENRNGEFIVHGVYCAQGLDSMAEETETIRHLKDFPLSEVSGFISALPAEEASEKKPIENKVFSVEVIALSQIIDCSKPEGLWSAISQTSAFSFGDNNRSLITVDRFLSEAEALAAPEHEAELTKLRSDLSQIDRGIYIDLEN